MKSYYFTLIILALLAGIQSQTLAQTTYYIDATNGNDETNSGTTKLSPFKSIQKANTLNLLPGDSVLFKRGEMWRWPLFSKSGNKTDYLYYGAYGDGPLPLLTFSENRSLDTSWININDTIWKCKQPFIIDVGNLIFDNEQAFGKKVMSDTGLIKQDAFYFDTIHKEVFIYSRINPAEIYENIECALRHDIVDISNASHVIFENLALKYGASHGFGLTHSHHIIIRNCEISYIGGGDLDQNGGRRYGNGVEFWQTCTNNLVENNKIWEIFDTGVTNQGKDECVQENITYRNNVIWNCGMAALEIWNNDKNSVTKNIVFENNTCANIGKGWGTNREGELGSFFAEFSDSSKIDSIFIKNNIVANTKYFYIIEDDGILNAMHFENNCYTPNAATDTFLYGYTSKELITINEFETFQQKVNDEWNSLLVDPIFEDKLNYDFHLQANSPCIDAGISSGISYDHDGNPRPLNMGIDIGAYETLIASNKNLSNNRSLVFYPNPMQNNFTINTDDEINIISIYNIQGKLLKTIAPKGLKTIGINLPQGIYFFKTVIAGENLIEKIVVK